MHTIPRPQLLDPERITSHDRDTRLLAEHRTRAEQLQDALHESCGYATDLWLHLDAVRRYLMESLPSDPRAPGPHPHTGAAPTGSDDEAGWNRWMQTYAATTSILAGPHGDSGFGMSEAKDAARIRRQAPNVAVLEAVAAATSPPPVAPAPVAATPTARADRPDLRAAGFGFLAALALRALLRPRRRRSHVTPG